MIFYILRKMDCPFYAKVKSDNYNEAKKGFKTTFTTMLCSGATFPVAWQRLQTDTVLGRRKVAEPYFLKALNTSQS